ncbi:MAG: pitrilysin family protein [Paludisphaera borealis]|uniref:M16 family metallopeptidase n=1 Tax=Paludisphaera borealis TaxID=1387353 RepID=UPI00284B086B|nr:pitrilysin family protein [Paludisphaera borealis]MDR3619142.1 pitrilysin family protein [Paludisphaera borealis]
MPLVVRLLIVLALAAALAGADASAQQPKPDTGSQRRHEVPALAVEKYRLPNGLTVLLHVDHKTPVAAVNIWYKVGSKDEKLGRTGFAHLFEHMMFQGSKNHDHEYFDPLEKLGANINGTTSEDRTVYYESTPSNALELDLWLEADRMGFLIPTMTQAKLDNQREVVKNERRESVDNAPYGQAAEAMLQALYPPEHPYHHSVIGSMADLSAASLADVSAFFRTHYTPNNAILCVAGDIDVPKTKAWIEKYFGPIPKGPDVEKPKPQVPALDAAKRVVMTDRVTLPRAELVWPTVPSNHPDEPALDVLAAVLGELDKENRLFRSLMYDRQLAAGVSASHPTHLLTGTFEVVIEARPGEKLEPLVKIALEEIERLKREGPTASEVVKSQNARESGLIMGLQSVSRKAEVFNQYEAFLGDPIGYRGELDRVFAVTPADVQRVAKKYLTDRFVEIDVVPGAPAKRAPEVAVDRDKQAPVEDAATVAPRDAFDRGAMPKVGPAPRFEPPKFVRRTLGDGLPLLVVERHELPIVSIDLVIKSGETSTPSGKEGLGSLAVSLLDEGTKTRSALQIAGETSEIGASLDVGGGLESCSASITTLKRHLDKALDLYCDVLLNPTFPESELDRLKILRLADIEAEHDSAEAIAAELFPKLVFGAGHPYGRPQLGTLESVRSITRADAVAFFEKIFVPANAAIVVVGDVDPEEITQILEARLKTWKARPAPPVVAPAAPSAPGESALYLVDKPEAAQSVVTIGRLGVARKSPDVPALNILNAILGGQFSSRLNLNLREDKGYSYGVSSEFLTRRGPGLFQVEGSVQSAVTREALVEMRKELTDVKGSRTFTDVEVADAKNRAIYGFPSRFETTFGVAGQLATLVAYDLPDDYLATYLRRAEAVTTAEVQRLSSVYITPETMTTLVIGDRKAIEPALKRLPDAAKIRPIDDKGNPAKPETGGGQPAAGDR